MRTEDFVELQKLVWLYTHIIDDRCFSRAHEVFTEDAEYDFTAVGGQVEQGLPAILEFCRGKLGIEVLHLASNIVADEQPDGTAIVRSRSLVSARDGSISSVWYEDVARRTEQGWRLCRRRVSVRGADYAVSET